MLLEGIFLPLTTPFHPDGRLFLSKLEANVDRYSRTPVAGLHLLGANAEATGLTDHEACEILGTAAAAAAPEKVLLAGVSRESVFATLALCEAAAAVLCDAVTLHAPAMLHHPEVHLELQTFFHTIADRSPLPVVLVSELHHPLPIELLIQLAAHPNILGAIDSEAAQRAPEILFRTKDHSREVDVTPTFAAVTARMRRRAGATGLVSAQSLTAPAPELAATPTPALKTRKKKTPFQLLTSSTQHMLAAFQAGVIGAVPRLGAAAPQACYEVFQAWKDQDLPLAQEKQDRLLPVAEHMEDETGAVWAKYGCDLNAYFGGRPRLPLLPLQATQREALERELANIHN